MSLQRIIAAAALAALLGWGAPALADSATHPARDVNAPATQVVPGDQIPWGEVGPGWALAALAQGGRGEYGGIDPDQQLLELIDPEGGRYRILTSAVTGGHGWFSLKAWSDEGRTALLVFDEGLRPQRAVALDLRTLKETTLPLPTRIADVTLRPDGRGLLAVTFGEKGPHSRTLLALDWSGERQLLRRGMGAGLLLGADGSRLVTGATTFQGHVLRVLDARDGHLVRRLSVPRSCTPVRWWTDDELLAMCWGKNATSQLYAVPVDGGPVTRLTTYHGARSADLGDVDAFELGERRYLQASGACGSLFLARQEADGSAIPLEVPGATGNVVVLAVRGGRLLLQHAAPCDGGTTRSVLSLFEPETADEEVLTVLPANQEFGRILLYGERRAVGY